MSSYRAQGILAAGFGLIGLAACGIPDQKVDLRSEGPPEILTVMILNENFDEAATFCAPDDEKVPVIITGGCGPGFGFDCCTDCIGICPEVGEADATVTTVSNAEPMFWQVRVVFDELLDPDVETLLDSATDGPCNDDSVTCTGHINTTLPFELECNGVPVAYDGYYNPAGNNVTLPPGPSIVAFPLDFVPTSADCTVTVKDSVVDKDNIPVASDEYTFSIAPLAIIATDPESESVVAADTIVDISFNSLLDLTTVEAGEIIFEDSAGATVAATLSVEDTELLIIPDAALTADETYTVTLPAGSDFADIGGGGMTTAADIVVTFTVDAAA